MQVRAAKQRYDTNAARWHAVLQRDGKADGKFFYSVSTTGVYCRPSCPSRLPLRENVAFHNSWEAAEKAGFRPCKRCQPKGDAVMDEHAAKIAAACSVMEKSEDEPSLDLLARAAGMSKFHFHRLFRKVTGLTPKGFARERRAERVRTELGKQTSVTEAIYQAGFNSNGRFYAESSKILGMTPRRFQKGGAGEKIRFAVAECSLGSILVAGSERGISAISLGDSPNELIKDLQEKFPNAELISGDKSFEQLVASVIGLVESPNIGVELPLDIRGTAFQRRVWQALRDIPLGSTASYAEIAKRIGMPKAVRAVASACAANKIAVAIPCHRVVRTGGGISGYRWGVERKRSLLEREGLA